MHSNNQYIYHSVINGALTGKKDFYALLRNQGGPKSVLFFGEGSAGVVLKFRLALTVHGKRFACDEKNFQDRLFLQVGSSKHQAQFVLTDGKGEYLASSYDDEVDFHLIAHIVRSDMLTPDGALADIPNSDIPHALNARFRICDMQRRVGVVLMVHSEPVSALWDYESDLMENEYPFVC